jgi:dipeptide/tripeptide permease
MEIAIELPVANIDAGKHPKEMYRVAFTTMWDMFSFYGMKALLIAYIVTQLRLGQQMGYAVLGTYAALVFGFNFFGGIVADKFLGIRKSVIWGGYLQIAGHLILACHLICPFLQGLLWWLLVQVSGMGPAVHLLAAFIAVINPGKKIMVTLYTTWCSILVQHSGD